VQPRNVLYYISSTSPQGGVEEECLIGRYDGRAAALCLHASLQRQAATFRSIENLMEMGETYKNAKSPCDLKNHRAI